MAISDKKTRTLITLEKTDKEKLEKIAKQENRSFNNLVETVLKDYLNK
ncbi:DNA-binding protein [Staphylococcus haemolyticus]|nr:DNA-binding protein [Staphylococcus haemolyticus]MWF62670.1 DNA-binding protein [Staphylococcus haemolyticus]